MASTNRFAGDVVLITGGTAGIGAAIADAFVAAGAAVAVCARSQSGLDAFAQHHPDALTIRGDVANDADRTEILDAVARRFGRLDILVNNAGLLIERDFAQGPGTATDPCAGLEAEIAVNLTAPIALTGATLVRWPNLKSVILVSSGYALVSPRRAPTYGATKAGLHGFAEGLRRQLAPRGTHVLEVLPPAVDTPATQHNTASKIAPSVVADATLSALAARRPVALMGQTRLLPLMLRLAPGLIGRFVAAT